ncbi:hypothetical protein UP12_13865 [Bacillus pumilus]|nr:hypothetical protein UP12_13865 [Bacillus pumilus]KRU15739.1 hypothetical protein AS142_12225 [Bacillus pumilus]
MNISFQCQNSFRYQNVMITLYIYILLPLLQHVKNQAFLVRKNNLKMVENNNIMKKRSDKKGGEKID